MSISLHRAMRFIPLALLLLSCSFVFSQTQGTFPVQVNCFFIPPHSLYISDYYAAERERVAVTLINRDMSTPMLSVRLRVFINGPQGVRLMSDPYINTEPIILDAGVPQRLTFDDLRPYVASMNVNAVPQGKFAEGVLEYCVQVVDANTGRILSLPSCARAHISNPAPPMLMLPRNKEAMVFRDPVSIMFQWTPRSRHIASVEYEFVLKEILDNDIPPQAAFLYSPELVRETVTTTNFIYNINYPMLLPGKRYAWAVQARTRDGFDNRNPFQNNGWTEIWWFTLQDKCDPVRVVNATTARRKLTLNWIGLPTHTSFVVSYRLSTTSRNDNWKEVSTDEASLVLNGLKEGGTYEYRIGSICLGGQPVFSEPFKATLPKVDSIRQARCGMMPVVNLSNREPLREFIIGESFMAGDFPIYVTSLESTRSDNGVYTGRGWTTLPWLVNARIAVEFRNITINSDGQMIEGFVEAMYDKNEGNIANLDALTHGGTGVGEVKDGRASAEYTVEYTIKGTDAFTLNAEEDLVIADSEGVAHTLQIEERTDNEGNKFKVFPVTVKDKDGKIYKVEEVVERDAAGNEKKTAKATLIGEQLAGFDPSQIRTTQLDGDVALVTFKKGKGRYAFDTWDERFETSTLIAPKYERVFREYYTPFKLVPTGKTDVVEASLEIKDTSIVASKIKFVTLQGTAYQSTWNENTKTFEIQLTGGAAGDGQELFAIHPKKSNNTSNSNNNNNNSSTSYYTLGKLKVMSYAEKSYKLNLVTVNNAKADVNAYATKLNEIYGPLGITWQVSSENISFTGQLKELSNRTGLSTYNETMRALNAAYREKKGESFDKSASVLFIIPESVSGSDEDRRGFMPRRSQFGYLMDGELSPAQAPIRAAHELGHGRFTLYHTFDDTYGVTRTMGETSNLMDYNGGTHLAKWQWDVVHDPALIPGVFEGDGRSEITSSMLAFYESTAPKLLDSAYLRVARKIKAIHDFLQQCKSEEWSSYKNEGIVPHCLWRGVPIHASLYYSPADVAFNAGLLDELYITGQGAIELPQMLSTILKAPKKILYAYTLAYLNCSTENILDKVDELRYVLDRLKQEKTKEKTLLNWIASSWNDYEGKAEDITGYLAKCREAEDIRSAIDQFYEVVTSWESIKQVGQLVWTNLQEELKLIKEQENEGRYKTGRIVLAALLAVGTESLSGLTKLEKVGDFLSNLRKFTTERWTGVRKKLSDKLGKGLDDLAKVDVPAGLISKLTQQGSIKLKAWTGKTQLSYRSLSGAEAEARILDDLNSKLGDQNVLEVVEDAQGRLLVRTDTKVYGLHDNVGGTHDIFEYAQPYRKTDFPLSANKLAPDFATTPYLYPVTGNQKNIVKIKMTGKRSGIGGDFVEASNKAGLGSVEKPIDANGVQYTWHHLDDFDPRTGECTMQLVKSSEHLKSLPHTGSVNQFEKYTGSSYK